MYNEEAETKLTAPRDANHRAITAFVRFNAGVAAGDYPDAAVRKRLMDVIKADALIAGIDIGPWDGTPAPVE